MADRHAGILGTILSAAQLILHLPQFVLILAVRCYQKCISPWLGNNCRFHPTCSQYFVLAVQKHGAIKGTLKGIGRICRCHPWNSGGEDWP